MKKFLEKYKATDEKSHTMLPGTTYIKPGKWYIPDNKLDEFYRLYAKEYEKMYSLVERHKGKVSPIVIDIDIKLKDKRRIITDEFIKEIIELLYREMEKYIDLTRNDSTCYVLQRKSTYENKDGIYKDGIHIQYPYLVTEYEYQIKMRKNLLEPMREIKERYNIEEPIDKMYDEAVIKSNGMMLYESSKYVNKEFINPYRITKEYKYVEGEIEEKEYNDVEMEEILKVLSLRNKERIECDEEYIKKLEIIEWKNKSENKSNDLDNKLDGGLIEVMRTNDNMGNDKYTEILELLPEKYYDEYHLWWIIGAISFNLSKDGKLYDAYRKFSKKSRKYNEKELNKNWENYITRGERVGMTRLKEYIIEEGKERDLEEINNKYNIKELQKNTLIEILKKYKKYTNNKEITEIGNVQTITSNIISVKLNELYCYNKKCNHDIPYLKLYVSDDGNTYMECVLCNVIIPMGGMKIEISQINNIFNIYVGKKEDNILDEIQDTFVNTIFHKTEKEISLTIYDNMGRDIIYSNEKLYVYDDDICIWKKYENIEIISDMKNIVTERMHEYMKTISRKTKTEMEWYKICEKKTNTITKVNNMKEYLHDIKNKTMNKDFENLRDSKKESINFKNGYYDLKNDVFRKREKDDYVTKYLDYDYEESDQKEMVELREIIKKISNDDEETLEFNLNWLGYCMTGERTMQKFLIIIGHSSQNGKSTIAEMFQATLPIYTYKLTPETFCRNYTKSHKQIAEIKRPIRLVYIEELPYAQLNEHLIKDFVTGTHINNEIMYGTSENIELQCKLYIASNNDPNFDTCQGFKRRCIIETLKNRFLTKQEYDEEIKITNRKYNIYVKTQIIELFNENVYKNAFFNLIKNYAVKFYENKDFDIPDKINKQINDLYEERDRMGNFLKEFYVITNDDDDKIHGDEFVDEYNDFYNTKLKKAFILNEIKKHNIEYNKNRLVNKKRGVLVGLTKKEIELNNDDI